MRNFELEEATKFVVEELVVDVVPYLNSILIRRQPINKLFDILLDQEVLLEYLTISSFSFLFSFTISFVDFVHENTHFLMVSDESLIGELMDDSIVYIKEDTLEEVVVWDCRENAYCFWDPDLFLLLFVFIIFINIILKFIIINSKLIVKIRILFQFLSLHTNRVILLSI